MQVNCISCFNYYKIKYCENYLNTNHFYLLTNALNCTKFRRLKSTCINILKGN